MEQAKKILLDFIGEILNGDLNAIRKFDFKTLQNDRKYGCPDRNFDCDDTNIMRAVYTVLWGHVLPDLNMENMGWGKAYRGDTINTFHTMFGREIPERPGYFAGAEKYSPTDPFREKIRRFGKLCSCIGNYVVLPNRIAAGTTLNCYRGTNEWHDFFDRFLMNLHQALTQKMIPDPTLKQLIEVNDFCFRKFYGKEGFRCFTENLLLNGYCGCHGEPELVFHLNYHWMNEQEPEQYFHDAELYLDCAERIILNRADKICEQLAIKLGKE